MKKVIGITGGIASGKSNVCNIISNLGYVVINCDKITNDLSEIDGPIYKAIIKEFGEEYLTFDMKLDKKKLAKYIFHDNDAKERLNSVTHPIIIDEVKRLLTLVDDGLVFVEAPLLYEAKIEDMFDKVICVFLKKKIQVERLMAREGIDEDYALAKIHSQMDLYMKKELADYVIDSKGSFDETKSQVINIINELKGV
ncbi:MAG: dephospho-CoA kinase [Acholeplasmatales bacterium]|nr:dephospho-CoA kinase [Acholeplasmatales bacterium]